MTGYISKEQAAELLEAALEDDWEPSYAIDRLNEISPADVKPVVRCKECKYYSYSCCSHLDHEYESHYQDYYCADGERKK